jgi:hypothetical protein
MAYSPAYVECLQGGPFAGLPDPWAEAPYYFHQLHGGWLSTLTEALQPALLQRGYLLGREASLQVGFISYPDLNISRLRPSPPPSRWDYEALGTALALEVGTALEESPPPLDALFIRHAETRQIVTILEILSPANKQSLSVMQNYSLRRDSLRAQQIHVVELDLTRSVKRLLTHPLAQTYPYHVAVHLHHQPLRFIGVGFGQSLPTFALPLRDDVLPVPAQATFQAAYRASGLAAQLEADHAYQRGALPFLSLLPEAELARLEGQLSQWRATLARLASELA